ncbi:hypothetical protein GCM10023168_30950 [Fodinibacter luteus]|uniref:Aminoglycoside phosphotransferase domain-containing protein n=1 Tax=Fodinibacter luteus TaxID=552064 RepID=A0ABP8KN76_9MICO
MESTWFERAAHPAHVSAALASEVPELRAGTSELVGCRVTRLRSAGDDAPAGAEGAWTATYLLTVRDGDAVPTTLAAHGTLVPPGADPPAADPTPGLTGDGWSCWLPDLRLHLRTWSADADLPGLAALTHEASARELLEPLLRRSAGGPDDPHGADDVRLAGCTATVASYKPGVRATVCCDLEYATTTPSPARPHAVVAKVHRPDEGRAVHDALEALWSSPLRTSPAVRIAEPLGYVDELGVSVQSHLDHELTLKDLLAQSFAGPGADPRLVDALRTTAAGIAALHTCGITDGPEVRWSDELAAVEAKHAKLAAVVPWLTDLTGDALARVAAAGERHAPDPAAPAHGSLRPAQVLLLDGGGLGLIDFDKVARAEPAVDLGLFLTKMRHTAVNKTGEPDEPGELDPARLEERSARVDALADAFLSAYRQQAPVTLERVRLWESLELFSLVLSAAKKLLPDRAATCAAMLERHLATQDR